MAEFSKRTGPAEGDGSEVAWAARRHQLGTEKIPPAPRVCVCQTNLRHALCVLGPWPCIRIPPARFTARFIHHGKSRRGKTFQPHSAARERPRDRRSSGLARPSRPARGSALHRLPTRAGPWSRTRGRTATPAAAAERAGREPARRGPWPVRGDVAAPAIARRKAPSPRSAQCKWLKNVSARATEVLGSCMI